MKQLMVAVSAALMGLASSAKTVTVYVAPNGNDANDGSAAKPVLNLSKAVELMRLDKEAEARRIIIRDGVYKAETNEVSIGAKDVNVTIEAEHPGKVLYTGAEKVTGWRPYPGDKRFLMADLPFKAQPRMLYMLSIGGANAEMASFPDFGGENKMPYLASPADARLGNKTVMHYDSQFLPKGESFKDLDLESAWLTIPQEWANTRTYILTNDWQHDTFVIQTPVPEPFGRFNTGFQIANCRLGMRHPGMWMCESGKGRIVYWPKEGETAETLNKNASISRAVRFFSAFASKNFVMRGLTFEAFAAPFSTPWGKPGPVVITLGGYPNGTDQYDMAVEQCTIRNCAGNGILLNYANKCRVSDCDVSYMGGTGVTTAGSSSGNSIVRNHIHHCGLFETAGACLNVSSGSSHYDFNHIHHSAGPGVVMWSYKSTFNSNHLHHTMLSSRDGGSLYGGYMFTELIGNWTHDTGNWPGLYNDEGGQRCVFTGNRFDGSWWPFHMHDCYGIVVTNNTITCDDAMRFSFQGSVHCVFSNNLIRTAKMITEDPYMECCDVWMDNRIELKNKATGKYEPAGKVTLPKLVKGEKPAVTCVPNKGKCIDHWLWIGWMAEPQGSYPLDRTKDGYYAYGAPGRAHFVTTYDSTNLYFHGNYAYNALMGYKGSRHNGHEWGKDDCVRFCFENGYTATVFFDQKCKAAFSDGATNTADNACMGFPGGVGDGWVYWAIAVPFEKTGLKNVKTAADAIGKEIKFNAICYNGDHDEYRYFMQPKGDDILTGRMKFVRKDPPDATGYAAERLQDAEGGVHTGAAYPNGAVESDLETAYRPRNDYDGVEGFKPRNQVLMGYVMKDRRAEAGHRAILVQPYTGEDPTATTRRFQRMEQSWTETSGGRWFVTLQHYDLETRAVASKNAVYYGFKYPRGGSFKIFLDANYAEGGEVSESEVVFDGATAKVHNRVKTGLFGKGYDVWAKMAFSQAPVSVKEVPYKGGKGKRYIVEFDMKPTSGEIVVKATVSETSAEDAAARFDAEPLSFDREALVKAAHDEWQKVLSPVKMGGDGASVSVLRTAIYGAYAFCGGGEKGFRVGLDGTSSLNVKTKGFKDETSRVKAITLDGQPLPAEFPKAEVGWKTRQYFKGGQTLLIEFE